MEKENYLKGSWRKKHISYLALNQPQPPSFSDNQSATVDEEKGGRLKGKHRRFMGVKVAGYRWLVI